MSGRSEDALIGRTIRGFRVTRFIARGGMGIVYEGMQESLGRRVVLKFLNPQLGASEEFRKRFEREARAIARLDHPNIVRVIDFGAEDDLLFMVLDFIEGETLRHRLSRVRAEGMAMRLSDSLDIIQQVSRALDYAHEMGIVHRDVKPGNILLGPNGRVYLTDFGVAKVLGGEDMTMTGAVVGTPEYMAPEQGSSEQITPAADIYALAVVTYELLTGAVPFSATTPVGMLHKQLTEPPPPLSATMPWFSREVDAVMMKALSKNPQERHTSAQRFASELTSAIRREPGTSTTAVTQVDYPATPPVAPVAAAAVPPPEPVAGSTPRPHEPETTAAPPPPPPPPVTPVASDASGASGHFSTSLIAGILALLLIGAIGAYLLLGRDGDGASQASGGPTATDSNAGTATAAIVVASSTETITPTTMSVAATATPSATNTPEAADDTPTALDETPTTEVAAVTPEPTAGPQPVIIFSSHRGDVHDSQIYVMALDGSGQRQLTFARGHSWGPRITPDGTMFFFSSVAPGEHTSHDAAGGGTSGIGNHDIYVGQLSGTDIATVAERNITNVTAGMTSWDNGWSWSPDGALITFTSDKDGNWEIYTMRPDGSDIRRLTDHPAQDGWPTWMPDGSAIIFSSDRSGEWEIYRMDPDGSNVRQLTNRPETTDLFPEVSPDGTAIVFSSQVMAVNEGEIYIMDIDGGNITRLTHTAALNNMPSWCPDSQSIVFVSDRAGNDDIYIMNRDGSGVRRLTTDPGEDTTPSCQHIGGAP